VAEYEVHMDRLNEDQGGRDAWIRSVSEYTTNGNPKDLSKLVRVRNPCYDLRALTLEARLAEAIKWIRLAAGERMRQGAAIGPGVTRHSGGSRNPS